MLDQSPALEAASLDPPRVAFRDRFGPVRRFANKYGLIILLLALPVRYAIADLVDDGSLTHILTNLKDGLSNGAIWASIALGYTLVYGIIELINFAHGDLFMIGSIIAFGFWTTLGVTTDTGPLGLLFGLLAALIVAMVACAFINMLIERVAYRPLRNAPKLAPLITAIGFSFILQNVGLLWIGGNHVRPPDLIGATKSFFTVGGVPITHGDALAFGVTVPLLILLTSFVTRSRLGKAMRATAQDPEAARLMGINVDTTIALTFILGGLMAGAAGLISALYQVDVWYFSGFQAGLIAFTAAVMGGIGNLKGAVLGGLIIGIIQQTADDRIDPTWTPAIVFLYLVLIMVLRPRGLIGEETREAG
ncbi:MAG: branched-chain amino acid transport system permease protein [Thermoleophilaceae bacterium]|nr:branched-chain amino acid transport system permease protein [Thermoleophilaceae bacterium]